MSSGFRLPNRFAPLQSGGLLSCFMSLILSGIATLLAIGLAAEFLARWWAAGIASWAVAFPAVLAVAPHVRRIVARLTYPPPSAAGVPSGAPSR